MTSHGKRLARIGPVGDSDAGREQAREALLERLASQPVLEAGRWTRGESYER